MDDVFGTLFFWCDVNVHALLVRDIVVVSVVSRGTLHTR